MPGEGPAPPRRVLVCGGRDFHDVALLIRTLNHYHDQYGQKLRIINGGATGADRLAAEWAERRHVPVQTYWAYWKTHGKKAGPIRNQRMLDEGKPDLVVAFPGGRGTADMVRRARAAGVPVKEVGDG